MQSLTNCLNLKNNEKCKKAKSADKDLYSLQASLRLAKKMGKGLGKCKILQQKMPE